MAAPRAITATVAAVTAVLALAAAPAGAAPVPDGPGKGLLPAYLGSPAVPHRLPGAPVPANPYMGAVGLSSMHADSYASDTYPFAGPLGREPQVRSEAKGGGLPGLCSTVAFARRTGLIVAQCTSGPTFTLRLIDPRTLRDLATYALPPRASTVQAVVSGDLDKVLTDTSGGAYYYLDPQDRAVVADAAFHVRRFAHARGAGGTWRFQVTDDWDLSGLLPHDCATWTNPWPKGACDPITAVGPDWTGLIWWVTRQGRVGTLDPRTGAARSVRLAGEEVQNSFAAAEDGVSVVSDHALYRMQAGPDGTPLVRWRRAYDRGTARKPGQIDQGSGTTPTFFGDGLVAITDNADDRMHVVVRDRRTGRLVCRVPVFGSGRSATDNSLIGYGNSLFVENNYGYRNFFELPPGGSSAGGVSRVDVTGSGCRTVWTSAERSPSTVAKASVANGLVYLYTKEPRKDLIDAWYLTAVDARSGRTAYKVLTGTGKWFDNNWAPITLGPDGTAYVGVLGGLVAVRDRG
ncbi:glycosyltransferase family 2 protein [Actinomadura parmotrematis]|uniref:Glycosyltransferase family 2 protein n=1 Tax=Actinomadura parmotrematis TaxID=2864039 RepID=A0ABS7FTZ8_9ACTN|nr:glycosyltransferase family 2 protein [Actinomadura parmotrematis]MBW8483670.1 glycosyltransferase family 2 protein [Actinomadura parmotrematis]